MPKDAIDQIERFKEFIETVYTKEIHAALKKGSKAIIIDFLELSKFDVELSEQFLNEPYESLQNAELAIDQLELPGKKTFNIHFINIPNSQTRPIRNIRSIDLDNLIAVEGIVRQASDVRPQVISAKFECPTCGNILSILQIDQAFKEPTRCSCGRKGHFKLLKKEMIDAQRIILEESPDMLEGGSQPKRLQVFVQDDLVEPRMEQKTTPGTKVRVIGILKEVPIILRTGAQSRNFELALEANNIEPIQEAFEELDISEEELETIKVMSKDKDLFKKLTKAIAPSIYGYKEIKASLLLQLFGGTRKIMTDGVARRGDIHILLVGDPGAGKSQLLQFISKYAPKARYISGKGASGAGLTATVVKDEVLRGWSLEAGAMVLANNGICAIDELDKMTTEDRSALHEALEQQTVTISKANIQATLRAETTVLAAANPKLSRFDPYTPIPAQIDLPPTLINRFDLIFPIRDLPNRDTDEKIAGHILKIHREKESSEQLVEPELMKKYIAYAKKNIKPKMSDVAAREIQDFYVTLRNTAQVGEGGVRSIPISARQLEAIVRLSEASAKLRLSMKVTKEDAKLAIDLTKFCLTQIGMDQETGQIDIDRFSTSMPSSERNKIVIIKEIISNLEQEKGKSIAIEDISTEAIEKGVSEDKVEDIIEKLKRSGDLFEPKRGYIQKI
ncbi:minichromosome maintenance protein MCM [archaeon]|nr:minichromosome maintenance protein MCM [archaeon]